MKRNTLLTALLAMFGLMLMPTMGIGRIAWARTVHGSDAAERSDQAADALKEMTNAPDREIPKALLDKAQGIAVIPHVVRAALLFGGRWGKGLMSVRESNGAWSAPAFVTLAGGSFGPQLGAEATDIVLVFTDRQGIDSLIHSKLKLGADASVAAGPVGKSAGTGTDLKIESAVYSYSRSRGLFAGIALDGAVISIDKAMDHKIYGPSASAQNILVKNTISSTFETEPFIRALDRYTPSTAKSA